MSLPIQQSIFHETTVFAKADMKLKEAIFTFLTGPMTKGVLCNISSKTFQMTFLFELMSRHQFFRNIGGCEYHFILAF